MLMCAKMPRGVRALDTSSARDRGANEKPPTSIESERTSPGNGLVRTMANRALSLMPEFLALRAPGAGASKPMVHLGPLVS